MTGIYIVARYNVKFDLKSKLIIHKQVLNNVILTFKCEAKA